MSIIFDGKTFASQKEEELKVKVQELKSKGVTPCLASILVGDDSASKLYVDLKKKAAERVGVVLKIFNSVDEIDRLNNDKSVHGIMIQLPIPGKSKEESRAIVDSISPEKDVDGLRSDSKFLHPTSRAVIEILNEAKKLVPSGQSLRSACVVGERGMVGAPLVKELTRLGYALTEDRGRADVLISATGNPGLISADMVKEGAIVIDVGSPVGDVDPAVAEKAAFLTPVPGGVGPVTIVCLLENLLQAI